jgi:pilus assembly protein Flp/PilA
MSKLSALIASIRREDEGQGLAEYALILALIAIIAIVALIFLGGQVSTILSNVGNSVQPKPSMNRRPPGFLPGGLLLVFRPLTGWQRETVERP